MDPYFRLASVLVLLFSFSAHAESLSLDIYPDGRLFLGPDLLFTENWNECQGNLTGNYVGLPCNTNRGLANEYTAYLKANLFQCVDAGLNRVGGGVATAVHLVHDGTVADENHSSASLHAAGRAIDILQMIVTTAAGKRTFNFQVTSSQPNGPERKFYEGFRACWGILQDKRSCPKRKDGYPTGTMGWEDPRHIGHHLHTSMPFCPDSQGHFITDFSF